LARAFVYASISAAATPTSSPPAALFGAVSTRSSRPIASTHTVMVPARDEPRNEPNSTAAGFAAAASARSINCRIDDSV
jgi:hypothetical protein